MDNNNKEPKKILRMVSKNENSLNLLEDISKKSDQSKTTMSYKAPQMDQIKRKSLYEDTRVIKPIKTNLLNFESEIKEGIKGIDIVFCIDTTGSMAPYLESIKNMIRSIISEGKDFIKKLKLDVGEIFKIGFVAYRDHGDEKIKDSYLTKKLDFTNNDDQINFFLDSLQTKGGLDIAEAVLDSLKETLSLKWRKDSQKFLIHFLDAPPHGSEYSTKSRFQEGCPCKILEEDIFYAFRDLELNYFIVMLDTSIELMLNKFHTFYQIEVFSNKLCNESNIVPYNIYDILEVGYDESEISTQSI